MNMTTTDLANLYEQDETAWLDETVQRIREGRLAELDLEHLAEYLEDMAARDRREVRSRLRTLMSLKLQAEFEDWLKGDNLTSTLLTLQHDLQFMLGSTTLRAHAEQVLPEEYLSAVEIAAAAAGKKKEQFPPICPFTVNGLTDSQTRS